MASSRSRCPCGLRRQRQQPHLPASVAATKARTIAVAAKKTKGTGTYRFALDTSMSVSDQKVDTHAEGVVDEDRGLASMTLDTAGAGGLMQSIEGGTTIYMKSPLFVGGKKWVKLDLKKIATRSGVNIDQLNQSTTDPSDYLTYLRAAGPVEEDGRDTVRGVDTTHYKGEIDLKNAAKGKSGGGADAIDKFVTRTGIDSMPYEAWIDDHGLLRRLAFHMTRGGDLAIDTTAELYDFGAPIKIALPAAKDTVDYEKIQP